MAYKKLFKQSPNYTPAAKTRSVWGVDRKIQAICIHWWGDPATKPSFEGVIAVLTNPARQASAHWVAEAGRACQLVNEKDNAWANNSGNPYTISIECNPRNTAADRQTIVELIADIRRRHGNLPLVPHSKYVATACPGTYNKYLKEMSNKANAILHPPVAGGDGLYRVINARGAQVGAYTVEKNAWAAFMAIGRKGKIVRNKVDVTAALAKKYDTATPPKPVTPPVQPVEQPKPAAPPAPPANDPTPDSVAGTNRIGALETRVGALEGIVKSITDFLSRVFKWQ